MENFDSYAGMLLNYLAAYTPKIILAIITLLAGLWIIGILKNTFKKVMIKREVDESLRNFLIALVSIALKILLLISVISMVGIETTSFLAIVGAAGLAIGLALQGSLSNFAGGVLILLLKPFKVGDYIEAQGQAGTVNLIQVFHTILKTPDNKTVILPNAAVANGNIINYSTEETRRVDFSFGISYTDDMQKAKSILKNIIDSDKRIMADPLPMVAVGELADNSVNITVRVWCNKNDYWDIHFDMFEKVKHEFDNKGISIPFPQTEIHIKQN